MKSFAVLLSLVTLSLGAWVDDITAEAGQIPMAYEYTSFPGIDIDLASKCLVQLEDGKPPVWMTELEKIHAKAKGINFFDITNDGELGRNAKFNIAKQSSFPDSPHYTEKVGRVIKKLSTKGPRENLEKFTSFRTRYYRSDTGKQSQQWLLSKIDEITEESASSSLRPLISTSEFPHSWGQNTIIVKINGSSTEELGTVIIGAHQDSTNMWPFLPAPGADDDGSGTVTILEAYRALLASDFRPIRNVEFHWYSAEEGGLLGSQAVARSYEVAKANIYAMAQFDMTAWVKRGTREEVGIITDFTDSGLTEFNRQLVEAYLSIPWVDTKCGYACSDHAPWNKAGYPSIFTIESTFENSNPHIHSSSDRIDISPEFSFEHMLEFSKLAVGLAVELGGWTKA
jgi:leucyl aminopeptidase